MSTSEQIIELTNKLAALNDKIDLVDGMVQFNIALNWTIILGVITITGFALHFISKSIIQAGIEKGIKKLLDDNKSKLNQDDPEIIGTMKFNNSNYDDINVRIVKLKDEPIINIETDKNNATLLINHKEVITGNSFIYTPTLFNGWTGNADVFIIEYGKYKLIDIKLSNLNGGVRSKGTTIMDLPMGYGPNNKINFNGYSDGNSEITLTMEIDGRIFINHMRGSVENINAQVVFISH